MGARPAEFPKLITKYPFLSDKKSFEGFLFPDTYRVRQGAQLEEVLGVLLAEFDKQIYSKLAGRKDWYNTLKLASIVEREERDPAEKSKVAGVLARRLEIGMSLGADATICYALALGSSTCTPKSIVE